MNICFKISRDVRLDGHLKCYLEIRKRSRKGHAGKALEKWAGRPGMASGRIN